MIPFKKIIKESIFWLLAQIKLPQLFQKKFEKKSLTIVTYHAVIDKPLPLNDWCFIEKSNFYEQMLYLKEKFNIINLSKAVELLKSSEIYEPTAVVTFDDGFQNNFDTAFPILLELGVPATIFLNTKFIDTDDAIWFCRINRAFEETKKNMLYWNGCEYKLKSQKDKIIASASIQASLKKFSHSRLLNEVRKIILCLGGDPDQGVAKNSPYRMLCSSAIDKMKKSGLIDFGAHTHSHAILAGLPRIDKKLEINNSIMDVEKLTNETCKAFAYPNGGIDDFDDETIKCLESCGIKLALTMIPGPNSTNTNLFQLKRYGIGGNTSISTFKTIVHHFKWKFSN